MYQIEAFKLLFCYYLAFQKGKKYHFSWFPSKRLGFTIFTVDRLNVSLLSQQPFHYHKQENGMEGGWGIQH